MRIQLHADISSSDDAAFNIIADIPGTDPHLKDEVVMIGAHFDSWTWATGASDDAAGCAVAMEAMRILRTLRLAPRRTIRMALWGGHEGAGQGSQSYFATHFIENFPVPWWTATIGTRARLRYRPEADRLSGYFNLDFGAGKIRGLYTAGDERLRPVFSAWLAPFADLGARHVSSAAPGGSEDAKFREYGLAGFAFVQDEYPHAGRAHHSNMDVYDNLPPDDLKQSAAILASVAYFASMRDDRLPRPAGLR